MIEIRGAGGGGKGGGNSGGHEADDTLFSTAYIEVIEAVSEGPVSGLVNGAKSIYMNTTPVVAADGTQNHKITWDTRLGWQGQAPFDAVLSVSAEQSVNTVIAHATPVIATLTNEEADNAVVTIGFPRMMSADDKANIDGASVEFKIECQAFGGSYALVSRPALKTQGAAVAGVFQSPANTFQVEIYLQSRSSAVDVMSSTDGLNWSVAETVTLTGHEQLSGWGQGSVTLNADEGVYYLKWTIINFYGDAVDGPGAWRNTVSFYSYGATGAITVSGKSMSRLQRQYRFALTGSAPWSIRVTRISADSTSAKLANELWFDSVRTEVVARLNYPNTALIYYRIPAAEFNSIPRRRAEWKLLEVQVPANYDPLTRVYTGVWDGSFKVAWTDNPAWCFYDLCITYRYGLGQYLSSAEVDKWMLYAIGRYCDELVDSGSRTNNGAIIYEPRFTLNILINQAREAFEWLRDLASVFRGMMYIINGVLTTVCDKPADAVKLFNQANVINGQFKFTGTGSLARKTVALVQWQDPADLYNTKVEYVSDRAGVLRYGINPTEIIAVGCTSRGQAHRLGKWALLDGELVTFGVGHDAATVQPGDIIFCQIPLRSQGQRMGGRLKYLVGTLVVLDAPVTLIAGHNYQWSVVLEDGAINSRPVVFTDSVTTDTLTIATQLDGPVVDAAIWVLIDMGDVKVTLWRVIDIKEEDGFTATITAMSYDPNRYAYIDNFDTAIDESLLSVSGNLNIAPPANLNIENLPFTDLNNIVQNKLHIHWSQVPFAMHYLLSYRFNAGNWIDLPIITGTLFEAVIKDIGSYDVSVRAVSVLGVQSSPVTDSVTITGEASVIDLTAQWVA